jgi:maltooligosyltrehalose trehalohydrolase
MLGERLPTLVPFEALKLAAGILLLSPYVPLIFMGEEYGEDSSFLYFVSHSDRNLIEATREGRKREFESFIWKGEPPDPQSKDTFLSSKIDWEKRKKGDHRILLEYYKTLINFRKKMPSLTDTNRNNILIEVLEDIRVIKMRRSRQGNCLVCIFNFSKDDSYINIALPQGRFRKIIDSSDVVWNGPGSLLPEELKSSCDGLVKRYSCVIYAREDRD